MNLSARQTTQAGGQMARERLSAYQRYAELVEAQEAALEAGDLEAFDELSRVTLELQATLGAATALRHLSEDPEAGTASFVEQVTSLLRSTVARNERIQARLNGLRHDVEDQIRTTVQSRSRISGYMEGSGQEEGSSLDMLF